MYKHTKALWPLTKKVLRAKTTNILTQPSAGGKRARENMNPGQNCKKNGWEVDL